MTSDIQDVLGKGLWRAGSFVTFLVAGVVLLTVGMIYALVGHREGFWVMLVGVIFWGVAAIIFFVFTLMSPSPPGVKHR